MHLHLAGRERGNHKQAQQSRFKRDELSSNARTQCRRHSRWFVCTPSVQAAAKTKSIRSVNTRTLERSSACHMLSYVHCKIHRLPWDTASLVKLSVSPEKMNGQVRNKPNMRPKPLKSTQPLLNWRTWEVHHHINLFEHASRL